MKLLKEFWNRFTNSPGFEKPSARPELPVKSSLRNWLRASFSSSRAVAVFYSVYIFIFSYYSVTRGVAFWYWFVDGRNYEWILLKSPLFKLMPISVIIGQWMFLQAVFIIYAQSKTKDAFLRGHLRYLIQTFWLVMVIWGSEIVLFKTPLIWISGFFVELIRGVLGGLYVVALYRMIHGLMALKKARYPSSAANVSVRKERSLKTYLLLIPLFFVVYWFAKWGSWYFVRPFYHPQDTHVVRVVTTDKTDVPIDAYIIFHTTNQWCREENLISGTKRSLVREIKLDSVERNGNLQEFRFDPEAVPGGWCGWKFASISLRDSRVPGSRLAGIGGSESHTYKELDFFVINPRCWLLKVKERWECETYYCGGFTKTSGVTLDDSEKSFCH